MKIICLDFDGVVHSYTSGWQGPRSIPDPPNEGALDFMGMALASGFRVAILSSRSRHLGGRWAMRRWLRRHAGNLWHDTAVPSGLVRVEFPLFKPPAWITIDDRAITFKGSWIELSAVEEFRPWRPE